MSDSTHSSTGRVLVAGSERSAPPNATHVGPPDPNERTTITIVVRPVSPSTPTANALAAQPRAARIYLTREQFAAQHGAAQADIDAVERFSLDAGLTVLCADLARRSVIVEGTLAQLSAAFEADLALYTSDKGNFRARTGSLTIPTSLDGIVTGVFGFDDRPQARAQFRQRIRPLAAAAAPSYTPPQVAAAYDFPSGATGSGQTVAIIELGGGYTTSDLDTYFSQLGSATPNITSVSVDGATNSPVGDPNSADTEVMLDIEVVGAIAPQANLVVYFAPNTDQGFLDAITTAIHDTTNKPTIVSISWGGPESSWTAQALQNFDAAFADAATLGVTVCVASGDNGSTDGQTDGLQHVDFPSSSPNVLACGGTTLEASGSTITSEIVWNNGPNGGATGGGVSDVFALPSWQAGAGVPPSANAGGHIGRGVPDVAGDADPNTGYTVQVDGTSQVIGGTSAVAPLWAALLALINQKAGKPAGFINAQLYASAESAFHDITSGNNGAYSAKAGWDACTGLGSPDGSLVSAVIQ